MGTPRVDLVQIYDECVMSYSESRDVLASSPGKAGSPDDSFMHAVLLDGRLIGLWKPVRTSKSMAFETSVYRTLNRAEKEALGAAQERYEEFVGLPAD